MIVANFTQYINLWTALIVLGIFTSAGEVGIYDVASRTATLSALVLISFGGYLLAHDLQPPPAGPDERPGLPLQRRFPLDVHRSFGLLSHHSPARERHYVLLRPRTS